MNAAVITTSVGANTRGRVLANGSAITGTNFEVVAGNTAGSSTGLSATVSTGDILRVEVISIGTTTPAQGLTVTLKLQSP